MARRRRGRIGAGTILAVASVVVWLALHTVIGGTAAAFLAGMAMGTGAGLAVARPRLQLRVSTRGTRARPLRRGRS
jgi:hypothetical protein